MQKCTKVCRKTKKYANVKYAELSRSMQMCEVVCRSMQNQPFSFLSKR